MQRGNDLLSEMKPLTFILACILSFVQTGCERRDVVQIRGHSLGILNRVDFMLQLKCGTAFNKSIPASDQWVDVTTEFKIFVECFKNELKTDFPALKGGTIVDDLGRPILVRSRKTEGLLWLQLIAGAKSAPKPGPLIEVERSYPVSEIGILDPDPE